MFQNFEEDDNEYGLYSNHIKEKNSKYEVQSISLFGDLDCINKSSTTTDYNKTNINFSDDTDEEITEKSSQEEQELINTFYNSNTLEKSESKNKKSKVPEFVRISDIIQREMYIKYYANDFYVYNGNGLYMQNLSAIESKILEINNYVNSYLIKEVLNRLRILNDFKDATINKDIINFKNCIYNLVTRKTECFNPDTFNTTQLNVNYIPDEKLSENKFAENFLDEISNGNVERKKALLQYTGYTLTMRTDLKKACYLYSLETNTGKSTYLEVMEQIVGEDNVCSVSLSQYSDRFAPSGIINKLLNSVAETKRKIIKDIENFKASVSGDTMTLEKKYVDGVLFKPYVKNWYAMNKLPSLAVDVAGEEYYSRLLIIKFERVFNNEDINSFNKELLFSQAVLDYIANIALREYLKMLDNNTKQFANEIESNMLVGAYRNADKVTTDVRDFLDTLPDLKDKISRYTMYKLYLEWCKRNKQNAELRDVFYQDVLETKLYKEVSKGNNIFYKLNEVSGSNTNV